MMVRNKTSDRLDDRRIADRRAAYDAFWARAEAHPELHRAASDAARAAYYVVYGPAARAVVHAAVEASLGVLDNDAYALASATNAELHRIASDAHDAAYARIMEYLLTEEDETDG